ncbi:hypothetical protein B0T18DRAFT_390421 [Schizothecium vesticola]|uniref:Uncharacterized protein n=1 Tax=Schizothecium vesticola TaxID=314040 RepID=A0AA40EUP8_9PEZI|nr:hypothetical protein B0T18DRAFT_390421 [Schizothecium vesticola]
MKPSPSVEAREILDVTEPGPDTFHAPAPSMSAELVKARLGLAMSNFPKSPQPSRASMHRHTGRPDPRRRDIRGQGPPRPSAEACGPIQTSKRTRSLSGGHGGQASLAADGLPASQEPVLSRSKEATFFFPMGVELCLLRHQQPINRSSRTFRCGVTGENGTAAFCGPPRDTAPAAILGELILVPARRVGGRLATLGHTDRPVI